MHERLAAIETDSAAQLKSLQDDLEAFREKSSTERTAKFAEFDEKIAANEALLTNMKKACPVGSVVTQIGDDGSLQCTNYKVQQAITEGCPAGEAVISVNEDGTSECAKVQAPVQSCPAGSSIQTVNAETGAVTCEKDGQDTEYASFFTVWGRQTCSGNGELVYSGAMGGGRREHVGGSAEYVCLPTTKPFAMGDFDKGDQNGAAIDIIELRSEWDLNGGNSRWAHNNNLAHDDMSCAVCKVNSPSTIVVAGHTTCPAGYALDYRGWLASEHYSAKKVTTHICLFNTPQGNIGQNGGNTNRGYLYLTEMERTALPPNGIANGYKYDFELSCAQCSSTSETAVSTYTRWGANSCPDKSRMLYDGFMAAGKYNENGGGATYTCMARGPEYTGAEGKDSRGSSRLYSVDYWTSHLPKAGTFQKVNYHDASCAVCEVPTSAVVTIPGTQKCPSGYEVEYKGLLMSGKSSDLHLTENICVDDAPVGVRGQRTGNSKGARVHPVEVQIPPIVNGYKQGREVGCAVCKATPERDVTTYKTWGRRACPSGSKTLYSGWMANGFIHHKGGGYNYQCMHQSGDIEGKQKNDAKQTGNSGVLYRVEYVKNKANNKGVAWGKMNKKNFNDAACAVCEVEGQDTMTYPAKTACPAGYKKLYQGYMAGGFTYHPHDTQYICLENDFESLDPSVFKATKNTDNKGSQLFLAEVDTSFYGVGYVRNRGLQCVVCLRE